jgi:hypothetical protein
VEVNLKNRYVPVAEIGYGTTDTTDDGTNIHYQASAPYFRIGMNYNVFFKKPYLPGFLYGGIRYGFTSFVISTLGSLIGVFCGKRFNLRMELWGGLVLIIIGVKILIEHLFLS